MLFILVAILAIPMGLCARHVAAARRQAEAVRTLLAIDDICEVSYDPVYFTLDEDGDVVAYYDGSRLSRLLGYWLDVNLLHDVVGFEGNVPIDKVRAERMCQALRRLPSLTRVSLEFQGGPTDGAIERVVADDVVMNTLAELPRLEFLRLGFHSSETPLEGVERFGNLRRLDVEERPVKVADLSALPRLECLIARLCAADEETAPRPSPDKLKRVFSRIDDESNMRCLASLRNVTHLYLVMTRNGTTLRDLSGMTSVTHLTLQDQVADDVMEYVSRLERLECLRVWSSQLTDRGLAHLRTCHEIKELDISLWPFMDGYGKVKGAGLAVVVAFENLEVLNLKCQPIDSQQLEVLTSLPRLREIEMSNRTFDPKCVSILRRVKSLRKVCLERVRDADAALVNELVGAGIEVR